MHNKKIISKRSIAHIYINYENCDAKKSVFYSLRRKQIKEQLLSFHFLRVRKYIKKNISIISKYN